jgi:putative lipoic acid-binding regulatory protein
MVLDDNKEKAVIEFPCDFPVKMMGKDRPAFHDAARAIIERHAGPVAEDSLRTASSSKGRFVSLTITIRAESQQQLDAIYMDLSAHEEILVAL